MREKSVWLYIEGLATALTGATSVEAEQVLNDLEKDLFEMPKSQLAEMRRGMVIIVAALSRLEVRLMENDGPHGGAY